MSENISAAQVKELRELTGAAMMDCKKALITSGGDMEKAIEALRKAGIAKADKKSGLVAAEGAIIIEKTDDSKKAVMIEINSQTDFVARDANFVAFATNTAKTALQNNIQSVSELAAAVEESRLALVNKVGENVQVRRMVQVDGPSGVIGTYLHGNRIGVMVALDVANEELARDIAMHIAASRPLVISPDQVSADVMEKEKEIYMAQAATSGKPADIIEKMVAGRVKKYLDEVSLLGQPFVKAPDMTVGTLLEKNRAKVLAFHRFEVGEGIEKVVEDFKEAVMSQVRTNDNTGN